MTLQRPVAENDNDRLIERLAMRAAKAVAVVAAAVMLVVFLMSLHRT